MVELRDCATPESLVTREPLFGVSQRFTAQCEAVNTAFDRANQEARLLQDFQVL